MNYRNTLLAAGAAVALAGLSNAQVDYSHNWQTMNFGFNGSLIFTGGDGFWGGLNPSPLSDNFGGIGDSLRVCYGVDATQGGTNESGLSSTTWFFLAQGHTLSAATNSAAVVSAIASSYDSAAGDACFTPLFGQADPATGTPLNRFDSTGFIFAGLTYGGATAVPTFWFSYFQVFNGLTGGAIQAENTKGTDPNGLFGGEPLLTHMVLEVQGPANESVGNIQYYLATTDEVVGTLGGGVTNGNLSIGEGLFGLGYTADVTGAVVHSRITSFEANTLALTGTTTVGFGGVSTDQWFNSLAFDEPAVWSGNDTVGTGVLNTGAGGMDWAIGTTVSTIQLRCIDMLSGGEVSGSTLAPGSLPTSVTNAFLGASFPYFLFSGTEASGTFQAPCGWCDLGGVVPMQAGSIILGPQATNRQGNQTVPICFDTLTQSFLSAAAFAIGGNFTPAADPFLDGDLTTLFEDGVGIGIGGSAGMNAPSPIGPAANPALAGQKLCITAALIEASIDPGTGALLVGINEIANVASVNLQ
ncbi:MAG: hypothetical protein ACYS26_15695 [Planctomycetota bacterium]